MTLSIMKENRWTSPGATHNPLREASAVTGNSGTGRVWQHSTPPHWQPDTGRVWQYSTPPRWQLDTGPRVATQYTATLAIQYTSRVWQHSTPQRWQSDTGRVWQSVAAQECHDIEHHEGEQVD